MFIYNLRNYLNYGDMEAIQRCRSVECMDTYSVQTRCSIFTGNYFLSKISFDDLLPPILIIHLENVNPHLVVKQFRERGGDGCQEIAHTFGRFNYLQQFDIESYHQHLLHGDAYDGSCEYCQGHANNRLDEWDIKYFDFIYKAHKNAGNIDQVKSLKFVDIVHFTTGNLSRKTSIVTVKNEMLYQVENGGFAINPTNISNGDRTRISFMKDSTNNKCFAIIFFNSTSCPNWKLSDDKKECLPISDFLYENEYRCYYKDGQYQENAYYGSNKGNLFDFHYLPDNVFVKILSYLRWGAQVNCRRVSQRWVVASDLALAANPIIINEVECPGLTASNFGCLIPIVANGMQSVQMTEKTGNLLDTHLIALVPEFRSLKEISFYKNIIDCKTLFVILDKCPKLKILTVFISEFTKPDDEDHTPSKVRRYSGDMPRVYGIESLDLTVPFITDPELMVFANYFPKLSKISLVSKGRGLTNSCLSSFVEKYSDKLTLLMLLFDVSPSLGTLAGIRECRNLHGLVLDRSIGIIDDYFISALVSGCKNLTMLHLEGATEMNNARLSALAALPNLILLNISEIGKGLEAGVTAIAREGRLEQLVTTGSALSNACLKSCIRYCPQLKLLDLRYNSETTINDVVEMIHLYSQYSQSFRLVLRISCRYRIWLDERVKEAQNIMKQKHKNRHLIIDARFGRLYWLNVNDDWGEDDWREDDSNDEDYEENDDGDGDNEDGDNGQGGNSD